MKWLNSWAILLLLNMNNGKYLNLSPRPVNQYDWLALWALVQEGTTVQA